MIFLGRIKSVQGFVSRSASFVDTKPQIKSQQATQTLQKRYNHDKLPTNKVDWRIDEPTLQILETVCAFRFIKDSAALLFMLHNLIQCYIKCYTYNYNWFCHLYSRGIIGLENIFRAFYYMFFLTIREMGLTS